MPLDLFQRLALLAVVAIPLTMPASSVRSEAESFAVEAGKRVALNSAPGDVRFRADARKPGGWSAEWADLSCASDSRVAQVKNPAAHGRRAYRIRVQEGDDSYGERCELGMANTGSSDIDRVGGSRVLFQNGTESWIAQQIMLDPNVYAFCGSECPLDGDGGLVQQLKQTGSCGTPANGIVARDLPRVGVVLEHRNSAENDCGNATMKSLWRVPIRRGAWIRILQHVRWSTDPDTGYIATWINGRPVHPSQAGDSKRITRPGDEVRIHTWTLKDGPGVDRLRQCKSHPCAHLRNGVYRNSTVSGDSVVYVDGTTVAETRAAAEEAAGIERGD
jgi:polysaccharide lyase-like protein